MKKKIKFLNNKKKNKIKILKNKKKIKFVNNKKKNKLKF